MPEKWLRCYLAMLPRLAAEEHLGHVSELMAGDGWVERGPRQRLIDGWQRATEGPEDSEHMTRQQFMDRMAAMGLFVEDRDG